MTYRQTHEEAVLCAVNWNRRGRRMGWSYNRLWIILVKKGMKRTDLLTLAGINSNALAHMGKNEPVTMNALGKICQALHCNIEDVVEFIPEESEAEK